MSKTISINEETTIEELAKLIFNSIDKGEQAAFAFGYVKNPPSFGMLKGQAKTLGLKVVEVNTPTPVQAKPKYKVGDILRKGRETVVITDIEWTKGDEPDECYYSLYLFGASTEDTSSDIDRIDQNKFWKLIGNIYKIGK